MVRVGIDHQHGVGELGAHKGVVTTTGFSAPLRAVASGIARQGSHQRVCLGVDNGNGVREDVGGHHDFAIRTHWSL